MGKIVFAPRAIILTVIRIESNTDMSFLTQLNWRYATKKFDTEKKISDEQLQKIQDAIKMAPSSFGLQPVHVLVITNPELREQLKAASWGQGQVVDASHLFVFCARTDLLARTNTFFDAISGGSAEARAGLKGYEEMVTNTVSALSPERAQQWTARQAYIALGFAMAACAELEIDSCPMEGFDPAQYHSILNLPEDMQAVLVLPVGFRHADDIIRPKFRFNDIFETRA